MDSGYIALQGSTGTPMRVVGANVPFESLIYLIGILACTVVVLGIVWHVRDWGADASKKEDRPSLSGMLKNMGSALSQRKMVRSLGIAGVFHACIVFGIVVLMANSAIHAVTHFMGVTVEGTFYIVTSISADISGLVLFVGLMGLFVIKYVVRPERQQPHNMRSAALLLALSFSCLSGYFVEGARIAGQLMLTAQPHAMNYEMIASPVGWLCAKPFMGLTLDQVLLAHRIGWWCHALFNMVGLACLPFGRLWHIVAAMFNGANKKVGQLREIEDFEDEESLGAQRVKNLKWTDFADLDACIECGACSVACPANNAGYPLNPKMDIILSLRDERRRVQKLEREARRQAVDAGADGASSGESAPVCSEGRDLVDIIGTDALWSCVTCQACSQACPLEIDHVDKLIDVRRRVTLWDEEAPDQAQAAFINLDMNQNPWGLGYADRADWLAPMHIEHKLVDLAADPDAEYDYLLFGGCFAAYDLRYRKVVAAAVKLLYALGVRLAYLGVEERCCGDSARRLGNEFLYQELARANIDTFKRYGVRKIVTLCPHCMNTLKNEYPRLDAELDVEVHHMSGLLADEVRATGLSYQGEYRMLVQEPCYLARYNPEEDRIVDALEAAGFTVCNEGDSVGPTCCGGGGGCMWLDDVAVRKAQRISEQRADDLAHLAHEHGIGLQTGMMATGCPYCMTMLDDAMSTKQTMVSAADFAEILWETYKTGKPPASSENADAVLAAAAR